MHLHKNIRQAVLMSPTEPEITKSLSTLGITVLPSQCIPELRQNEQYHADMQVCIIKDTAFIPENCLETAKEIEQYGYNIVLCRALSGKYPNNIALNVALVGNKLFCKESATATEIKSYCKEIGIDIISVNQGYTKCSTLVLGSNAIITADKTIYKAAQSIGVDVLKITPGSIRLQDADYGFIGGCSGVIGDMVYFFGDIKKHPESDKILAFIKSHGMKYTCLSVDIMNDIGGFIALEQQKLK